ncbi:MAG: hypothetical protein CME05_01935 [Gemmatimonadaceae bacterium]|nr:hypothetical protein [Gemmatimonadaceae bacterium]
MLAYPMLFGFTVCCEVLPDQGLADPYTRSVVVRGEPSVRAERTDDVVLGQALLYACLHGRLEAAEWLLAHESGQTHSSAAPMSIPPSYTGWQGPPSVKCGKRPTWSRSVCPSSNGSSPRQ